MRNKGGQKKRGGAKGRRSAPEEFAQTTYEGFPWEKVFALKISQGGLYSIARRAAPLSFSSTSVALFKGFPVLSPGPNSSLLLSLTELRAEGKTKVEQQQIQGKAFKVSSLALPHSVTDMMIPERKAESRKGEGEAIRKCLQQSPEESR